MRDAGLNFDKSKDYDWIKRKYFTFGRHRMKHIGYAGYYLEQMKYKSYDEADASLYRQLVDIDTSLGTKASDQLFVCLTLTSQSEFIKVRI